MITVGTMRLPQPEPLDDLEAFLRGLQPDGGYWETVRRLADHDHSGGLMGVPVSGGGGGTTEVTITGSEGVTVVESPANTFALGLTASATAGNTLVVNADGLYVPAGAVPPEYVTDAELATALGPYATDTDLANHVAAADPHAGYATDTDLSTHAAAADPHPGYTTTAELTTALGPYLTSAAAATTYLPLAGGTLSGDLVVSEATPTVALKQAADTQPRARLTDTALGLGPGGTTAPDATLTRTGAGALRADTHLGVGVAPNAAYALTVPGTVRGTADLELSSAGHIYCSPTSGYVMPNADNTKTLGHSGVRWVAVYAVNGTIQTSSREAKEGIAPLDPARAMEAVRTTEAVTFAYKAPARPPVGDALPALPDDPQRAQAVLEERLRAAPLEAGARHQAGFVAEDADALFLVGEGQTSPGNTCGVLLAACQWLGATVDALTARVAALEGGG